MQEQDRPAELSPAPATLVSKRLLSRPAKLWLILGLLALWALIMGGVLLWVVSAGFGTDTEAVSVAQAEAFGRFRLPSGATGFRARLLGWQDTSLQLRFEVPAEQVDAFLESTSIERPLSTAQIPQEFKRPPDPKWWTPGSPTRFRAGASSPSPTTQPVIYQYVLIDETDPARHIVWFFAHDQ